MARKRMIDPGIWQSEDFSKLSTLAKLVFIGLFSNADDSGRGRAKAAYIKSILFPYDEGMRVIDVDKTLSEIASNMSVTFYLHDENEYYSLEKWEKWQRIDRPSESTLPEPDDSSQIIRASFDEGSTSARRAFPPNRKEENKNKKEEKRSARENARESFSEIISQYSQNLEIHSTVADFLAMRNAKQKPATERALKLVFKELDKLSNGNDSQRIAILEQSTRNGWTDVYPLKSNGNRMPGKTVVEQQYPQRPYDPAKYTGFTPEEIEEMKKL